MGSKRCFGVRTDRTWMWEVKEQEEAGMTPHVLAWVPRGMTMPSADTESPGREANLERKMI